MERLSTGGMVSADGERLNSQHSGSQWRQQIVELIGDLLLTVYRNGTGGRAFQLFHGNTIKRGQLDLQSAQIAVADDAQCQNQVLLNVGCIAGYLHFCRRCLLANLLRGLLIYRSRRLAPLLIGVLLGRVASLRRSRLLWLRLLRLSLLLRRLLVGIAVPWVIGILC